MEIFTKSILLVLIVQSTLAIDDFETFKIAFNKSYETIEQELEAEYNFMKSLEFVQKTPGTKINAFSDLTEEQFNQKFLSSEDEFEDWQNILAQNYGFCNVTETSIFPEIDLRKDNVLTPVREQGACGSCWAFSTICTVESNYLTTKQAPLNKWTLSEQQLVDCASPKGCDGEKPTTGFKYLLEKGVTTGDRYPYVGKVQPCRPPIGSYYKIRSFCWVYPPDPKKIQILLSNRKAALTTVMKITNYMQFRHYDGKSVIETEVREGKTLSHAVNIVGYGKYFGKDAWIVRNSWGTSWGDKGYCYVSMNSQVFRLLELVYSASVV
ncbi:Sar s 1 allergen (cysteine protease-like protein 3) [Sarcoptes scabiei]|uniref:Sar s 1 allergen (Cysteine protease-like protein 3) n=1 Tax=Sarcoptes scabiei TaxID=52283 RepID=A0A132A278_SARSC|nr:Sar s 1 allergen (cysteine protease-like protein 3) [Sarcoptes scabiei]